MSKISNDLVARKSNLIPEYQSAFPVIKMWMIRKTVKIDDFLEKEGGYNKITVLDLKSQNLQEAENIVGMCENLLFISLKLNEFNSASAISSNLHNLLYLDLSQNNIRYVGHRYQWEQLKQLRVLDLSENKLSDVNFSNDFRNLEPLTNLMSLNLRNNNFQRSQQYLINVMKTLPRLCVLDEQVISECEFLGQQISANYQNNAYMQKKGYFGKIFAENSFSLNCYFNMQILQQQLKRIVNQQSECCPVRIIQKYVRLTVTRCKMLKYKTNAISFVTTIQSFLKMRCARRSFMLQIKLIQYQNKANQRCISTTFKELFKTHLMYQTVITRVKRCQSAMSIIFSLRQQQTAKQQKILFHGSSSNLLNQAKYSFIIAKPFTEEKNVSKFVFRLLSTINEMIMQKLEELNVTDCDKLQYNQISVTPTDYQYGARRGTCVIMLKRRYKSFALLNGSLPSLYQQHQKTSRKLQQCIVPSTHNLQKSFYSITMRELAGLKLPKTSRGYYHRNYENSAFPFGLLVTIQHKYLAAILQYLLNAESFPVYSKEGKVVAYDNGLAITPHFELKKEKTVVDLVSIPNQQNSQPHSLLNSSHGGELGEFLITKLLDSQTQQQIFMMFKSGQIPYSFSYKELLIKSYEFRISDRQEIVHFSTIDQLEVKNSCMCIQKLYRQLKSNKIFIQKINDTLMQQNQRNKPSFFSVFQILSYVRSSKIIQKYCRGYIGRKQHLIEQKMIDTYKSAALNGVILVHKLVLRQILNLSLPENLVMRRYHQNISQMVSVSENMNIFKISDKQALTQPDLIEHQNQIKEMQKYNQKVYLPQQFVLLSKKVENMYSSFSGQLYSQSYVYNSGVASIISSKVLNNDKFGDKFNRNINKGVKYFQLDELKNYLRGHNNYQLQEVLGIKIKAQLKQKTDDSLDAIKILSSQQATQEDYHVSTMLEYFSIEASTTRQSTQNFLRNFALNLNMKDFTPDSLYSASLHKVAKEQFRDFVVIETKNKLQDQSLDQQLAIKALALELRFYSPHMYSSQDQNSLLNNYIHRKLMNLQDTEHCVTFSYYQSLFLVSTIVIQSHFKKVATRKKFKQLILRTTMLQKLSSIDEQRNRSDSGMKIYSALNLIGQMQQYYRSSSTPIVIQQTNNCLTVQKPVKNIMSSSFVRTYNRLSKLKSKLQQHLSYETLKQIKQKEQTFRAIQRHSIHSASSAYKRSQSSQNTVNSDYRNTVSTINKLKRINIQIAQNNNISLREKIKLQLMQDQPTFVPVKVVGAASPPYFQDCSRSDFSDGSETDIHHSNKRSSSYTSAKMGKRVYSAAVINQQPGKVRFQEGSVELCKQRARVKSACVFAQKPLLSLQVPQNNSGQQLQAKTYLLENRHQSASTARQTDYADRNLVHINAPHCQVQQLANLQANIANWQHSQQLKQKIQKSNLSAKTQLQRQYAEQQQQTTQKQEIRNQSAKSIVQKQQKRLQTAIQSRKTALNTTSVVKSIIKDQ